MNLLPLTILSDHDYFADMTARIAATKPGDRVGLMTMSFNPTEPLAAPLMHALNEAARRGVSVQLNVDAHAFMTTGGYNFPSGPLFWHRRADQSTRPEFKAKFAALEDLRESGGHYCITNPPTRRLTNPFAGRSHIKLTVINNVVYVGGCNLGSSWQLDMMVRLENQMSADWIYDFMLKVAQHDHVATALGGQDMMLTIDDVTTLIIDAGLKNQSLIYERALRLIDEATAWIVITCQFFPGKTTAEHLLAAQKRGVQTTIYFGHESNHGILTLPHRLAEWQERWRLPKAFFAHRINKDIPRLHAKLLATEQSAMIGGHNYVVEGVRFGTAESTLFRRDPAFANRAVAAFEAQLAAAASSSTTPNN